LKACGRREREGCGWQAIREKIAAAQPAASSQQHKKHAQPPSVTNSCCSGWHDRPQQHQEASTERPRRRSGSPWACLSRTCNSLSSQLTFKVITRVEHCRICTTYRIHFPSLTIAKFRYLKPRTGSLHSTKMQRHPHTEHLSDSTEPPPPLCPSLQGGSPLAFMRSLASGRSHFSLGLTV